MDGVVDARFVGVNIFIVQVFLVALLLRQRVQRMKTGRRFTLSIPVDLRRCRNQKKIDHGSVPFVEASQLLNSEKI